MKFLCSRERNVIETCVLFFPCFIIHLSLRTERVLTFSTSLLQAFWWRTWQTWGCLQSKSSYGLDFVVTPPDSLCVLFGITSEHFMELKWLTLDIQRRWFHLSRVGFCYLCIWFGFLTQFDSIKMAIKRNSVGPVNMSHCRTSSFHHLDHCFVVFKHIQQSFLMRESDVWGNRVNRVQNNEHSLRLLIHVILITENNGFRRSNMVFSRDSRLNNQIPWMKSGNIV